MDLLLLDLASTFLEHKVIVLNLLPCFGRLPSPTNQMNQKFKKSLGDAKRFNIITLIHFKDINPEALHGLSCAYLDLSGNELEHLPPGIFLKNDRLNVLSLGNNNITRLQSGVFEGLVDLQVSPL